MTSYFSLGFHVENNLSIASIIRSPILPPVNPASFKAQSLPIKPKRLHSSLPSSYTSLILEAASSALHLSSQIYGVLGEP